VGEGGAGGGRGETGDVDVVLDGEGHAVERQVRGHRRQLVRPRTQHRGLDERDPGWVVGSFRQPFEHGVHDGVRVGSVAGGPGDAC
jgi:hypothetical protein